MIASFGSVMPFIGMTVTVMVLFGVFVSFGVTAMLGVGMAFFVVSVFQMIFVVFVLFAITVATFHFVARFCGSVLTSLIHENFSPARLDQ
jgi:hypothetical protein